MPTEQSKEMLSTLKAVAGVLRERDIPFAVGGGIASWVRGGPATEHDLDLVIRQRDVDAALDALEQEGFRTERPPEEWLVKAWDGPVLVDLVFRPSGFDATDELIERCPVMPVESVAMKVLPVEDVLVSKLLAMDEHHLTFEPVLEIGRALREQIDWNDVWKRTEHSPFARSFFALLEGLEIVPEPGLFG